MTFLKIVFFTIFAFSVIHPSVGVCENLSWNQAIWVPLNMHKQAEQAADTARKFIESQGRKSTDWDTFRVELTNRFFPGNTWLKGQYFTITFKEAGLCSEKSIEIVVLKSGKALEKIPRRAYANLIG